MEYKAKEYWQDRLAHDFSLAGTGHSGFTRHYNTYMYKRKASVLRRACTQWHLKVEGEKVLDIGCGTGFFVDYYLRQGASKVAGIDITNVTIARLREKYPSVKFYQCDIAGEMLPIGEKFDIVNAFDVLYHITDDRQFARAIENISNACHVGSWLCITDALAPELASAAHVKYRSLETYKELLGRYRVDIMRVYPLFHFLGRSCAWRIPNRWARKFVAGAIELSVPLIYMADLVYCPLAHAQMKLLLCQKK